ncbi:hypothetical protein PVK06_001693 [Gossypium arboreum]|uniref:Uncharacterized protein n=1 Tax=Gossypium arboreum TaxID=29729 RepID=A0ABR0R1N9_GOSAR|nr:hypothetical protein PVK06_001693 [Gossypium arboreum]
MKLFKFVIISHSDKGSDVQSDTPLVTIKNLAGFTRKLQCDLNEANDKLELMFDKLQQNLEDRNAQDQKRDIILDTISKILECLSSKIEHRNHNWGDKVDQPRLRANNARCVSYANDETLVNNDCGQHFLAKSKFLIPEFHGKNDQEIYCDGKSDHKLEKDDSEKFFLESIELDELEMSCSPTEMYCTELNIHNTYEGDMGSEAESPEKTERKETLSDKSLLDGPNLVSENLYKVKLKSSQVGKKKKTKDSGMNFVKEGRNDAGRKAQNQAHERDGLKFPQGTIMRSKAKQIQGRLNKTIQDFVTKALNAHTTKKENQDSLSYFQENQETESLSNFVV